MGCRRAGQDTQPPRAAGADGRAGDGGGGAAADVAYAHNNDGHRRARKPPGLEHRPAVIKAGVVNTLHWRVRDTLRARRGNAR